MGNLKFENVLLLLIVILAFIFLGYAYFVTVDTTVRGVILGAVIGSLNTSINFRFGSSKSSQTKDATIQSMQDSISNPTPIIKTDVVNADNVETVNTQTTNLKDK